MNAITSPKLHSLVWVRSRRHLVDAVTHDLDTQTTLVALKCIEDDALGESSAVLWELEVDAKIITDDSWSNLASRGFDKPEWFQAYYNTLRWGFVTSTEVDLFQAPYRAGIQVQPYQLEPLKRAIEKSHVNLFIADDVGLGKTIEAGLVLREMIIRQKVQRCVISAPPSVVHQWREEMEQRFGLHFVVYDRAYINEQRRQRGFGVNPWTTHNFFIVSHAMIRRHEHITLLNGWLGDNSPQSMLILDEAHHAAPASGSRYAIDSKLTKTMRQLCSRFAHRLFLSATPHNGHSNSFRTLLELLDPNRFNRGVEPKPELLKEVMIRRLKVDLRSSSIEFPERKVESISIEGLSPETIELKHAKLLREYWLLRKARLLAQSSNKRRLMAGKLPIILLQKRLLSSVSAFHQTLALHLSGIESALSEYERLKGQIQEFSDEQLHLDYLEGEYEDEDGSEALEEEVTLEDMHARMKRLELKSIGDRQAMQPELHCLKKMLGELDQSNIGPNYLEAKLYQILTWLNKNVCEAIKVPKKGENIRVPKGGKKVVTAPWQNQRVIIFTEYADTKDYLVQALSWAIYGDVNAYNQFSDPGESRIATFHGGMDEEQRRLVRTAFNQPFNQERSELRILVATDAAREGINLQSHCDTLFHYDIPWNPGRMEQRNGRIDRKLQPAKEVYCKYFVLTDRVEDRVLHTLVEKSRTIENELGSFNPVIGSASKFILQQGIDDDNEAELKKQIADLSSDVPSAFKHKSTSELAELSEDQADEYIREEQHAFFTARIRSIKDEVNPVRQQEIREELDKLDRLRDKAKKWIDFDQTRLQDALNSALAWMNLPPLQAVTDQPGLWTLPDLTKQRGHDSSWTYTLDALRASRKAGQKLTEWRDEAEIRPIVFEDDGSLHQDRVQLHLEHRVVRRLLQRFVAHGFTQDELNRAAVIQYDGAVSRVYLLARLSLYGQGASRLHDELVMVEAELFKSNDKIEILSDEKAQKLESLNRVQAAILNKKEASSSVVEAYRTRTTHDIASLRSILEQRGQKLAETARGKLTTRGLHESEALQKRLNELKLELQKAKKELQSKFDKLEDPETTAQQSLSLGLQERLTQETLTHRQIKLDLEHISSRLKDLQPRKITAQAKAVAETFEVKLERLEPIGILYLHPQVV
jgi:ERCC4-related helicase